MAIKLNTSSFLGIDGSIVSVEVDIERGLPSFNIVGLADTSVKESKERVKASIINSGFEFPIKKIVVNLAPADMKKAGSLFDLPIAVGILICTGQMNFYDWEDFLILGELSLSGNLNKVRGVLPITLEGIKNNIKNFIVPIENAEECSSIKGVNCYAFENLKQIVYFIKYRDLLPYKHKRVSSKIPHSTLDFSDVFGQESCKRALEVASAGNHNVLMAGPPGSGKTMMARRVPTILPNLNYEKSLEVTKIYSVTGNLNTNEGLITKPPFRSPHHTITAAALIGGGNNLMPGEISLAHNGVLFLDEVLEFKKNVLEVLRQPLEEKRITINRCSGRVSFPCNFMTIMATNPCPCGNFASGKHCTCTDYERKRYISKLSSPFMDRIDLFTFVTSLNFKDIQNSKKSESSKSIRKRVEDARKIQKKRFMNHGIQYNSEMNSTLIKKYCKLNKKSIEILAKIYSKYKLTTRAYSKILKVSRTIADLDHSECINESHLTEALCYRKFTGGGYM
ncbi:YifB family Mg chelatase-like AAA ATPase [Clostridium sp. MT-14]|uniref:YifB family Mg chelatase-like AAA ATPase n=1 Tax=Clostridium aromativorans TaxID=2836848 RepID=A0ABS8N4A7_9CLOT|nr:MULTISPECIES: YifB family Mg chelatase-like AAA ATPase [Clostridium]KAA8677084.1 YifB family Mg chelatase-like AAA ATPase [Clostridium sp. HV4-5-A1G]MCC9294632.1 YifB family Mg chelatase-like AAA ATPase [Clostridium aromativorans]CAB1243758.1 Competence protein ComM [Clostridiaceae bacterium BL-3]